MRLAEPIDKQSTRLFYGRVYTSTTHIRDHVTRKSFDADIRDKFVLKRYCKMTKTLSQPSPTEPPEEKRDSRALPRRTVKLSVRWFCYPAVSDTDVTDGYFRFSWNCISSRGTRECCVLQCKLWSLKVLHKTIS